MGFRRGARYALAIAGVASVPLLAGCSVIEQTVTQGVQDAVEQATGGDVQLSSGLPDGFPVDAVPLVDGDVRGASQDSDGTTRWVVSVTGDVSAEQARELLEDAGYAVGTQVSSTDIGSMSTFSNDSYDVTLIGSDSTVVYTVTPK